MSLTPRGWAVSGLALGLLVAWHVFGEAEIGVVAFALAGGVATAALWVSRQPQPTATRRRVHPETIHAGMEATIELEVRAPTTTIWGVRVIDVVEGLGTADFVAGRLDGGLAATATYRVLAPRRGVYQLGPVRFQLEDPFGLVARARPPGSTQALVVYPATEPLEGAIPVPGLERSLAASRPDHGGGDEFYTLREYRHGDDTKQIHWPSTARQDRLMTRQMRERHDAAALVVLDVRSRPYPDDDSFERAVVGAASVVARLSADGFEVRLLTGSDPLAAGYEDCMERLAVVFRRPAARPELAAARVAMVGPEGVAIIVTGRPDQISWGLLAASRRRGLMMAAAGEGEDGPLPVVHLGPGDSWSEAWRRAQERSWGTSGGH